MTNVMLCTITNTQIDTFAENWLIVKCQPLFEIEKISENSTHVGWKKKNDMIEMDRLSLY